MKKRIKVKFIVNSETLKKVVISGNAGKYKSVESGTNALNSAKKIIKPLSPSRDCILPEFIMKSPFPASPKPLHINC